MNAMVRSDLIIMRRSLIQLFGICLIVCVFIAIGMESLIAGIAAVVAMVPMMYMFSIVAYDEANGWERFRLTLPISRHQVVLGRYASILIVFALCDVLALATAWVLSLILSAIPNSPLAESGQGGFDPLFYLAGILMVSAVMIVVAAISTPLFLRFGITKGSRLIPLLVLAVLVIGIFLTDNLEGVDLASIPILGILLTGGAGDAGAMLCMSAVVLGISLLLLALSALIALRLYEHRGF